jgi:transposase
LNVATNRHQAGDNLNPTEGVWSHVKRSLGNLATTGVDHLAAIVRNRLKRIQYRPDLLSLSAQRVGDVV